MQILKLKTAYHLIKVDILSLKKSVKDHSAGFSLLWTNKIWTGRLEHLLILNRSPIPNSLILVVQGAQ